MEIRSALSRKADVRNRLAVSSWFILLFLLWQMIAEPPLDGRQVGDLPGTCSPRDKKQAGIPEASARGRRRAPP